MSIKWNNRIKQYFEDNPCDPQTVAVELSSIFNETVRQFEIRKGIQLQRAVYVMEGQRFHIEISMQKKGDLK